ncbi:hypothetical protein WAF17_10575 [Bernardetia sp. ABR2-2B]|uniref:hypothetical protein n=1 Tax=Bernardetia sp. ABR2-2B TaxID=3127472 RepID=UPI0030CF0800
MIYIKNISKSTYIKNIDLEYIYDCALYIIEPFFKRKVLVFSNLNLFYFFDCEKEVEEEAELNSQINNQWNKK